MPTDAIASARPAEQLLDSLVLDTTQMCHLLRCSLATLHRRRSAGQLPRPIKWGGKLCWRADEVKAWVTAGMPDAKTWEATKEAR
jgi:predicted DNA-binding transcriptional regulator AlpA